MYMVENFPVKVGLGTLLEWHPDSVMTCFVMTCFPDISLYYGVNRTSAV